MRRRVFRRWLFPLAIIATIAVPACTSPLQESQRFQDAPPGYEPELETDEAGLWMAMEEAEARLKTSPYLVRDPGLNGYLREIVCRLSGPRCGDIRVYLMRVPHFNASMAPNGLMMVWTGLLLRAENEAQLAYVLGHEIGHYLRRHSIQLWRDQRQKAAMLAYFQIVAPMAGVSGYTMDLARLATAGSLFAFSRDAEREADQLGFEITTQAGYDPGEASKLWRALLKEREAADESEPWVFFQTHPPTEERIENLELLHDNWRLAGHEGRLGSDSFNNALAPWRMDLFHDELHLYQFERSQVVLDRLLETDSGQAQLLFYQGELYRLRDDEGDRDKAVAAYRKAIEHVGVPPQAFRNLGLLLLKQKRLTEAQALLSRYLELEPEASDQAMIQAYLRQVE